MTEVVNIFYSDIVDSVVSSFPYDSIPMKLNFPDRYYKKCVLYESSIWKKENFSSDWNVSMIF